MVILIILIFLFIAFLDIPVLIIKKMWRELATVCVLIITGLAMSLIQVMHVPVPSPNEILISLITKILNVMSRLSPI